MPPFDKAAERDSKIDNLKPALNKGQCWCYGCQKWAVLLPHLDLMKYNILILHWFILPLSEAKYMLALKHWSRSKLCYKMVPLD